MKVKVLGSSLATHSPNIPGQASLTQSPHQLTGTEHRLASK